ncbi:MFS transporter [Alicyclobacillus fodiniaquatilis]|uniref:MFS transporter n=1 Tax=Alicyclobacillus fodiniaquatilis TaxID=1661150 RepID=A0ABW4JBV5_9BACL
MSTNLALDKTVAREDTPVVHERAIVWLLGLTVIIVIMNTSMFNLALPEVATQFSLNPSVASWVVTGYSIVFALSSITYSRLSDFVPIRTLMTIAGLSLGGASIMGIFSDNFGVLLGARLIQATGAGAIMSLSYVFLSRYIPQSRRGRAMAMISSAASLGLGLGPVVGGAIVQYLGWHVLFVVTAVTLLLVPFLRRWMPNESVLRGSFDALGASFIGIGVSSLLLCLTDKNVWLLLGGILAIALFILRIRRTASPFVLPKLFGDRQYLLLASIGIGTYMVSFTFLFISMLALALCATHFDWAVLAFYILTSISFTAATSAVSNEMSRQLSKVLLASGMGLFQMMQFFSGALGVTLSGSALVWQRTLPANHAFDNILWGMVALCILTIISSVVYCWLRERNVNLSQLPIDLYPQEDGNHEQI